jgi:hypothetical protein
MLKTNNTIIAPTYTIINIKPKNSKSKNNIKALTPIKVKINDRAAYRGFFKRKTNKAAIMVNQNTIL